MRNRRTRPRTPPKVRAALCVTCLVDTFYPQVGEAVVAVLRRLGVDVTFPQDQTCCGQVAYNGGFHQEARETARRFLDVFEGEEPVVVPSGSCAAMIKLHYLDLFRDDHTALERAERLAQHTHEFSYFLVHTLGHTLETADFGASFTGKVTYQESCHLLRDLGVSAEPRALLNEVHGAELIEMDKCDTCCGFGGLFSVKFAHISMAILEEKLAAIAATGADVVVANDMGCLMHLGGAMARRDLPVRPMHLAELLAGQKGR